jgi:hypothetical protein
MLQTPLSSSAGTEAFEAARRSYAPRLRLLLGVLIAAAVLTHLILLGLLQAEQSGYESSSMVYCEVDGDDSWDCGISIPGGVCTVHSSSVEGEATCTGGGQLPSRISGTGAVVGSFEWKVSYALAQHCKVLGSQLAVGTANKGHVVTRQPMLCPAALQKDTKQPGRCKVPPTACTCSINEGTRLGLGRIFSARRAVRSRRGFALCAVVLLLLLLLLLVFAVCCVSVCVGAL